MGNNDEPTGTTGVGEGGEGTAAPDAANTPTDAGTLMTTATSDDQPMADAQDGNDSNDGDQTDDQTDGEGKEGEDQEQKQKGAPEKYDDFQMPEGTELDSEVSTAFQDVAKDLDLSQEQAQGLIDKVAPVLQRRSIERIEAISNEWAERSKVDQEFGGQKLDQSLSDIARLRDMFARNADGKIDDDIQEFLSSPMGNHPGALRFLARIGRRFGEAKFPDGGVAEDGVYTAEQFYKDSMKGGK